MNRHATTVRWAVPRARRLADYRVLIAIAIGLLVLLQVVAISQQSVNPALPRNGLDLGSRIQLSDEADETEGALRTSSSDQGSSSQTASGSIGANAFGGPKQIVQAVRDATGITAGEIKVVYYWKAEKMQNSEFLPGDSYKGAVDEAEAFRKLVEWINRHRGDPNPTFLGLRYNLHGRRIVPVIREAGRNPTDYGAAADAIAGTDRPFAAISSHGSLSAYICPTLAENRILNISTYNLDWNLFPRTGGYCVPQGMTWDGQVQAVDSYLRKLSQSKFQDPRGGYVERIYGFTYWEYPGLVDSAPKVVEMLRASGVNIQSVKSMEADTVTAQRQAPFIVEEFRAKGVNTVIMPEAGSPLAFTPAAAAKQETFDYVVWPCSGQDTTAMVRLFDKNQWTRASGLSCWDQQFDTDLTNDQEARGTEWFRMYQEVAGAGAEPPAQTPYVALSLLGLLAGITNAGPDLNDYSFSLGLPKYDPYRYNAITGRSADPLNMLFTFGPKDGNRVGDVAKVIWDPTMATPGGAGPGGYRYLDGRRFRPTDNF